MCTLGRSTESGAIGRRRRAYGPSEGHPKGLKRNVAALFGNVGQDHIRRLQELLRAKHALALKPEFRRHADRLTKPSQERALAHRTALGEIDNVDRLFQALTCPLHDRSDRPPRPLLNRSSHILRLATIAMWRHHQSPRDSIGNLAAEIS